VQKMRKKRDPNERTQRNFHGTRKKKTREHKKAAKNASFANPQL